MINDRKTASWFIGSLFLLSACSSTLEIDQLRNTTDAQSHQQVEIPNVPFFAQERYQCGPAALAMLLNWSGVEVTPDEIKPLIYVPGRKGSFQVELITATRTYNRIPYVIKPGWQNLIAEIEAGNPVLVFQNLGMDWFPNWHYAVVKGIDIQNDTITLHSGITENYVVNLETFERTWLRTNKWAMVVMRPENIPVSADALSYIKAVSVFEKKGELELALKAYQASVNRWPTELIALMGLGNVYYQLEQLQNAKFAYEKAIAIDAEYAPAHNNLAQVLMDSGRLDIAYKHAQIAVQNGGPHTKHYLETLEQIQREQQMHHKK